jgi:hypothetical protein
MSSPGKARADGRKRHYVPATLIREALRLHHEMAGTGPAMTPNRVFLKKY